MCPRLAQAVTVDVARGAQIESHTAFSAVVVYPTVKTCNHPWHAVLTLFTCGLWVVVWLLDWGVQTRPPHRPGDSISHPLDARDADQRRPDFKLGRQLTTPALVHLEPISQRREVGQMLPGVLRRH